MDRAQCPIRPAASLKYPVIPKSTFEREKREKSRNAHGALPATVTAQHTEVATVSKDTDRPRQSDMDRPTHACTRQPGARRSFHK